MEYYSLINKILVVSVNIFSLWLGLWVYFADRRNKLNRIFLLWVISTSLWITMYYLVISSKQSEMAIFFAKMGHGAVSLFYIPFYLFFIYFLNLERRIKNIITIIYILGIALFIFSTSTNLIVKGIEFRNTGTDIILSSGAIIFYLFAAFSAIFVITLLLRKYFKTTGQEKVKIQYFLIGILIWAITNLIFNIIPALLYGRNTFLSPIGNYSFIFLLGFTAFAIVKHELFGIRVVLTALLVGVIAIILAIQIFTAPSFGWRMLNSGVLAVFCLFGYYLVKAVQQEEKRREEAEMMVVREGALRKRAEKLGQEFKRLDESKTQFMLAAQHHLRTPLTAIQGYLSMLYEGSWGKINPEARSKIKSAFESTRKLIKLVNEFLDIAQFEVGKEAIVKQEIQIEDAIQEVVNELKPIAEEKGVYLKFEKVASQAALPRVMADPEKIKEAIYNVINNAIKYTRKGGVTINIKYQKSNIKNTILIMVSDTGIGMERDEILGLFQKSFARGEEAKKLYTTGRGIGLYLTYQIVKAHGGRVWAESEGKDRGSTFYVELPVK